MSDQPYSEITLAALTGEISTQCLYDPPTYPHRAHVSGIWKLETAIERLCEGGYVIDLRPLCGHPDIYKWAVAAPMPDGRLTGDEIDHLDEGTRRSAWSMMPGLVGEFQTMALLMAAKTFQPIDGEAGPFDYVSAQYRALWWGSRGARIGQKANGVVQWSDEQQAA